MPWDGRNKKKEQQAGTESFAALTTDVVDTKAVVFSVPFDAAPSVVVTTRANPPDNLAASADNVTTDGFDLVVVRRAGASGAAGTVSWQAMAVTQ